MPGSSATSDRLAHLSDTLRPLAQRGELKRYRKGTLIVHEGEPGHSLFIIVAGRLRCFASGEREREITYGVYGPGEYLGEMSLDGGPRSASIETLEASECAIVTRIALEQHIADHPEFAFELLAKVIRRARAATLTAKQLALNDVYGRLVALLNALASEASDVPGAEGGPRRIDEHLTHRDMAARLGCSREMVSRQMKDLEAGGYLRAEGKALLLLKPLPARW
ncbi:MAG TPA: Crp/Fnr family transcriptional regulator [Methylibium sp.]|uniref:Crp/Fnr family transcriptional regulator n=1 Tax=Methylibium sp. TaxID=2067992 RepID=UPI002DBAFED8|nr:Crp/Fnr family transcriptional regulator [Methylibium sp.]HEU4458331.1 Crp/Fnr family transcriptional regulator [Methylibium sp.]